MIPPKSDLLADFLASGGGAFCSYESLKSQSMVVVPLNEAGF